MPRPLRLLIALVGVLIICWGLFSPGDQSDARWLVYLVVGWMLLIVGTRISLPASMPTFNRSLIRTALVVATVFIVISAQLVRVQVVRQEDIYYRTEVAPNGEVITNPRLTSSQLDNQRGKILDRNGVVLADTVEQDGQFVRTWPVASAWPVTGYYSPLLVGSTGLEATYEQELSGQAGNNSIERTARNLLGQPQRGANLNLTLDADLQTQAMNMLGESPGAVVVMDVHTGAVVAMASNPTYDPNQLFTNGNDPAAQAYWDALNNDAANAPLVTRANLGLYTPGSTFKCVSAGIAIEQGYAGPDSTYTDDGQLDINGRILVENNRPDDTRTEWTMRDGIAWSLNVVFAQVGMQIGGADYWTFGPRLGFGQTIPFDVPVAESQIANSRDALNDTNLVADTGFGQGQIQVTPLHLAMIAAMYANGGTMMQPYLVDTVTDADGNVIRRTTPQTWKTPFDAATANQVRDMMINAVNNGSIQAAITNGYVIGGKTGTAEIGNGSAHSLFIGFIGNPDPQYAVAVVLEGGYGGLVSAVQIGRDMMVMTIERRPD